MYYYCKNNKKKILHNGFCFCILNSDIDSIGSFETLEEAYAEGYRLCKHCSPLASEYRKELKGILAYSQENGIAVESNNRFIKVTSPSSMWKIAVSTDEENIRLYHKNTFETSKDALSPIAGYHLQRVYKSSILGYLEYIVAHDRYRRKNPLYIRPSQKASPPPRKGTKRYKSTQRRAAKIARKKAIRKVLTMIDSLQFNTAQMQVANAR